MTLQTRVILYTPKTSDFSLGVPLVFPLSPGVGRPILLQSTPKHPELDRRRIGEGAFLNSYGAKRYSKKTEGLQICTPWLFAA